MEDQNKESLHRLTIKNKRPGELSTGLNTQILLDGKPLKGVKFLKIEAKPKNVIKVQLEMVASIDEVDLNSIIPYEEQSSCKYDNKYFYEIVRNKDGGTSFHGPIPNIRYVSELDLKIINEYNDWLDCHDYYIAQIYNNQVINVFSRKEIFVSDRII